MKARVASSILLVSLGVAGAVAVSAAADPPVSGAPAVIYKTRTVHVQATYQGLKIRAWANRAVRNRREANTLHALANHRGAKIRALQRVATAQSRPSVDYALRLASAAFSVPYSKLRSVAHCESTLFARAVNGQYRGLFQEGPMFERGAFGRAGFSVWDPIANAMTAAQTVIHDGSWRQWSCG